MGEIILDSVTLFRYTTGTVKNCDSGGAPQGRPPFVLERCVPRQKKMVLIGGRKPHLRKATRKNWSKAKEQTFLSTLAETVLLLAASSPGPAWRAIPVEV